MLQRSTRMDARLTFDDCLLTRAVDPIEVSVIDAPRVDLRPVLDDAKAVIPSAAIAAFTGVISMVILWQAGMTGYQPK